MARVILIPLIIPLLTVLILLPSHSATADANDFVYGGCSRQKYVPNSPYESSVDSLLTSLANSATYSSFSNYTIMGSSPQDVVYGLSQCRGDLSMPDCATCVARAITQMGTLCPGTCGAAVQLQGCYVKYDNATFLGVEDKTVVLKKCGPSVGYNSGPMDGRDAVFSTLSGAVGAYRIGGSGQVQGVAQCVGDLSMGECQDCLLEAIGRLRSDCSTAVYGDMYLAKCYAKYWTGGGSGSVSGGGGGGGGAGVNYQPHDDVDHDDDKSNDEGEKTFAIIIGLLAGVALLIIFLTFIRKVFDENENGK